MSKVSVLVLTYRDRGYLASALESVFAQTYQDFDVTVVNDGGGDDSYETVANFPRARFLKLSENRGISAVRNFGIENTSGEYVALIDDDDLWSPTKLERQVALMDAHPNVSLCHTNNTWIDSVGGEFAPPSRPSRNGYTIESFPGPHRPSAVLDRFGTLHVVASSTLFRRERAVACGLFTEKLRAAEDYHMWILMSMLGDVGYVESFEIAYRKHVNNLSSDVGSMHQSFLQMLQLLLEFDQLANDKEFLKAVERATARANLTFGAAYYDSFVHDFKKGSDLARQLRLLAHALMNNPKYASEGMLAFLRNRLANR